jgi:hypothetical protein
MILQLDLEPLVEELGLLLLRVNVVCPVLCEVVELAVVLIDGVVPLLHIVGTLPTCGA